MSRPQGLSRPRPRIGVLSRTQGLASSLAAELGIANSESLSPRSLKGGAGKGVVLQSLIVEVGCWPLEEEVLYAVLPLLEGTKGYIHVVSRICPTTLVDNKPESPGGQVLCW